MLHRNNIEDGMKAFSKYNKESSVKAILVVCDGMVYEHQFDK